MFFEPWYTNSYICICTYRSLKDTFSDQVTPMDQNPNQNRRLKRSGYYQPYNYGYSYNTANGYGSGYGHGTRYGHSHRHHHHRPGRVLAAATVVGGSAIAGGLIGAAIGKWIPVQYNFRNRSFKTLGVSKPRFLKFVCTSNEKNFISMFFEIGTIQHVYLQYRKCWTNENSCPYLLSGTKLPLNLILVKLGLSEFRELISKDYPLKQKNRWHVTIS